LADALDAPFTAFQAPGPANGHEPPETVTAFAARYVDALLSTDPRPSYQLGGWSSGAVIAAEMAVILEKRGLRVDRLVVVDAPAPLIDHRITDADVVAWFLEDLDVGISAAEMAAVPRTVPSAARLAALIRPHANLADTDIEATFAVFRNVVTATNRYIGTPCTADITVIRATDGAVAEFDNHPHRDAAHWGWTAMTSGSVTAAAVTGTHHTLLSPERAAQVAAAITAHRSKPTGL
jgi:thioesterase domain-containing protein